MVTPGDPNGTPAGATRRAPLEVPSAGSTVARLWVPWFILAVALILTGMASLYVRASTSATERARFDHLVEDAQDQAAHSMDLYGSALKGVTGLYAASGIIDRRAFDAYTRELDLPARYQGISAIGFCNRVAPADRASFLAIGRQESGPTFDIWPAPPAGSTPTDALVVRYVAPPSDSRRRIIGYDMTADPVRRRAMADACDTAAAVATPGINFIRSADGVQHSGFLIYVPIYRSPAAPATIRERREQLAGLIYAAFRTDGLFLHWVNANVSDRLQMRVTDAPAAAGTVDAMPVLFDSTATASPDEAGFRPRMRRQFPLSVAGRTWTVNVAERPAFYSESDRAVAPLILLGGFGISLVLFAVARSQALAHAAAEQNAAQARVSQQALAASQSRLRRLVDANLIGVFFCDLGGEVSGGNDEFFRLLSQPRGGDGKPLRLAGITVPEHRQSVEQALRQVSRDGVCPAFETAFLRSDGEPVPVLLGVASVEATEAAGHIPGAEAVAFALDLTDRHRAERDLRVAKEVAEEAREAAERANRSKDQFLAVLSHELRTPLTPVLATTAASAEDPGLPPAVRDEMAMIHRNVELEARLIDDLLDLTRIGRGKLQLRPSTVDVHQVIADAIAVCPPDEVDHKRLAITRDLRAGERYVHGDSARLQQVFWNLVKNAIKFTPPDGRITIRSTNEPADPLDEVPTSWLVVEVVDTGLGVEAEVLPKIFDAFEQGSVARAQASGGLGLGLAISRGLVDAHGGRISATSAGLGAGATFTVRLRTVPAPAAVAAHGNGAPPAAAAAPAANGACRILLVEDHADTARVMARLLQKDGHAVAVAHTRADAIRVAAERPFDLLISDLGLPDGSGIDVVGPFRKSQATTAGDAGGRCGAIALTGFGAEEDVNRALAAGFDEHLTKPVSFGHLQQAIGRVLAGVDTPSR
jgi:signal transduction histidine kinase/CHASE1-domain containing sensor protein/ActR/RegA family two-component response regulator